MDEARLEELRQWLAARIGTTAGSSKISEVTVEEFGDFAKIMELARAGFLNSGNRLARIDYRLTDLAREVALESNEQRLTLRDILVENVGYLSWAVINNNQPTWPSCSIEAESGCGRC